MRTITVFYDHDFYTLTWLRALVWAEKEFCNQGYRIEWDYFKAPVYKKDTLADLPNSLDEYVKLFSKKKRDIVFLAYHHSIVILKMKHIFL